MATRRRRPVALPLPEREPVKYKKIPKPVRGPAGPAEPGAAPAKARPARSAAHSRSYGVEPFDTWFFRESRPHAAIGGQELASLFPPPARSLWGMLAHTLGRDARVDWRNYIEFKRDDGRGSYRGNDSSALQSVHLAHGRLRLRNVSLCAAGQRWYPAPAALLHSADSGWLRLAPGAEPVATDLGPVYLPSLSGAGNAGAAAAADAWFSAEAMTRFLAHGELSALRYRESPALATDAAAWTRTGEWVAIEPRLGIAVSAASRKVEESMLFQTGHLRAKAESGWQIAVDATLLDAGEAPPPESVAPLPEGGFTCFGSEARPARLLESTQPPPIPALPANLHQENGRIHLLVYFATAADFSRNERFVHERDDRLAADRRPRRSSFELRGLPRSWTDGSRANAKTWVLTLHGSSLELVCVAAPRPAREGGWSLSNHQPEDMRSLVPAGTCWYCTTTDAGAAAALHGKQLGDDLQLGRGQIFVGTWKPHR